MKNFILIYSILFIFIPQISLSQKISYVKKAENPSAEISPGVKNIKEYILNPENKFLLNPSEARKDLIRDFNQKIYSFNREAVKEKKSIIIRNNISIGGFINDYAVINYKPELKTSPAGFLSVYVSRNILSLIPLKELNQYYRTAAIQSALFFVIDNSVNIFLYKSRWTEEIAGFILKNILINLFFKGKVKENNRNLIPQINDEYYYYSVSIRL